MTTIKIPKQQYQQYQEIKVPAWFKFIKPIIDYNVYYQIDKDGNCTSVREDNGKWQILEGYPIASATHLTKRCSKKEFDTAMSTAIRQLTKKYIS